MNTQVQSPASVRGQRLVGSDDELDITDSPPICNPLTPGSPVFPGLVQKGDYEAPRNLEEEAMAKQIAQNTIATLMRNSVQYSPSKTRSPSRHPRKRNVPPSSPLQSPNGKRLKQLKMDAFSPQKQPLISTFSPKKLKLAANSDGNSPFKVPHSPNGKSLYTKFDTVVAC